jgi:hypothetical protein
MLDTEFDVLCARRHKLTEEQGINPLEDDTIEASLNELADLALNARYTYMRIRLLQEKIKRQNALMESTKEPQ